MAKQWSVFGDDVGEPGLGEATFHPVFGFESFPVFSKPVSQSIPVYDHRALIVDNPEGIALDCHRMGRVLETRNELLQAGSDFLKVGTQGSDGFLIFGIADHQSRDLGVAFGGRHGLDTTKLAGVEQ